MKAHTKKGGVFTSIRAAHSTTGTILAGSLRPRCVPDTVKQPVGMSRSAWIILSTIPQIVQRRDPDGAVLICPFEFPSQAPAAMSSDHGPSNLSLPSKAVDFRKTTVLII
ncbi:MAG: hypothetical protein U5R49_04950 [Deltaproteobacteria bacterium]|nr:hypothetical protein [Deltaproteobacteria bacterium]